MRGNRNPGEVIDGTPVKRDDVLIRYSDRAVVEVLGFRNDPFLGRIVRMRSRLTGAVNQRRASDLRKAYYRAPDSVASNPRRTRVF